MHSIEIIKNNQSITFYGNKNVLEAESLIVNNLPLIGNERKDRLLIQKCMDDNNFKSSILYNGNSIYPFKKVVQGYRALQKSGKLNNLTEVMYDFFINACGDIAHYNKTGFKDYYNNSLRSLENILLSKDSFVPQWKSDVERIFKELKICKYFNERENVDLNTVPIHKLKEIVEECGWKVEKTSTFWSFEPQQQNHFSFKFNVATKNNKAMDIINELESYYNSFDKDKYIKQLVKNMDEASDEISISDIVHDTEYNKVMLSKLIDEVSYKLQNEALILASYDSIKDYELNLEIER